MSPLFTATTPRMCSCARLRALCRGGRAGVIRDTLATQAEFPDRELLGEDVIWSGSAEGGDLLSSHRILSTATHTGEGLHGAPTGRRLCYRVIADCAAKDNMIYDEWLARDHGAVVRQLGREPKGFAAELIRRQGGPENCPVPLEPENDPEGPYKGRGNDHATGRDYAGTLERIMGAEVSRIEQDYDRACQLELPGGRSEHGWGAAAAFWTQLRTALPDAAFRLEHCIGRDDPGLPPRAALRWSLHGVHAGWGAFGPPSGAELYVLGFSHAEFGPWGLRREFVIYDEVAVWKQIVLKTG